MRRLCYNGDKSLVVMDYLESSMQLVHFELPNRMQGGLQGNTMKELMELGRLTYLNQDQYGSWKVNSYNASSWDPIQIPCQQMNRLPRCLYQTTWPSLSWRMSFFTGWRHLRIYKSSESVSSLPKLASWILVALTTLYLHLVFSNLHTYTQSQACVANSDHVLAKRAGFIISLDWMAGSRKA